MKLDIVSDLNQKFQSDSERIKELETLMNELYGIVQNEPNKDTIVNQCSTLIKTVKSQYENDSKYLTAKGITIRI